jgi:hypothetical protein
MRVRLTLRVRLGMRLRIDCNKQNKKLLQSANTIHKQVYI